MDEDRASPRGASEMAVRGLLLTPSPDFRGGIVVETTVVNLGVLRVIVGIEGKG